MLRSVRHSALAIALGLVFSAPASAVGIDAVLSGLDVNFRFSVIHTASSGYDGQSGSIEGYLDMGAPGGTATVNGPALDVSGLTLTLANTSGGAVVASYDVSGSFDLAGLLDTSSDTNTLLGWLDFSLASLPGTDANFGLDGRRFYFENRDNYSGAGLPPNSLSGVFLTLWGSTNINAGFAGFDGTADTFGEAFDLAADPTGGARGIDLRLELSAPIPEPSARPLYLAGLAIVGFGAMRLRKS